MPKQKWSKTDMENAIKAVKEKALSIRAAGRTFNVQEGTIRLRLRNEAIGKEMVGSGRRPTLNKDTETDLVRVISSLYHLGFSPTREQVKDLVSEFVRERQLTTSFKDDRPGKDWLRSFMTRNNLCLKKAQKISNAGKEKVATNPFIIYHFYDVLEETVKSMGIGPNQIWNCYETGFPSDPKYCKVINESGEVTYCVTLQPERENTTILAAVSADGKALPPLNIVPRKKHQDFSHSENG